MSANHSNRKDLSYRDSQLLQTIKRKSNPVHVIKLWEKAVLMWIAHIWKKIVLLQIIHLISGLQMCKMTNCNGVDHHGCLRELVSDPIQHCDCE